MFSVGNPFSFTETLIQLSQVTDDSGMLDIWEGFVVSKPILQDSMVMLGRR